jgi:hypothetical protein
VRGFHPGQVHFLCATASKNKDITVGVVTGELTSEPWTRWLYTCGGAIPRVAAKRAYAALAQLDNDDVLSLAPVSAWAGSDLVDNSSQVRGRSPRLNLRLLAPEPSGGRVQRLPGIRKLLKGLRFHRLRQSSLHIRSQSRPRILLPVCYPVRRSRGRAPSLC